MNNTKIHIISIEFVIAMTCVWLVLSACTRIPLYQAGSRIEVIVDWDIDSVKEYRDIDLVQAMFYHRETHALVASHILPAHGGEIIMPPGTYDLLLYDLSAERTQVRAWKDRMTIEAYTENKDEQVFIEGQQLVYSPDHFYVARKMAVEIPAMQDTSETVTIRLLASSIVEEYRLEVAALQGAEYVSKVEAFISSQARANYFGRPQRRDQAVTLYLNMSFAEGSPGLQSFFQTFGKLPDLESRVWIRITVINQDGSTQNHNYDITDEFYQDDHDILIPDTIEVEKPDFSVEGGMQPDPVPWEDEKIVITL